MEKNMYSCPLSLRSMKINDKFWKQEMEVVRKEVIPVSVGSPERPWREQLPVSVCRNFKVAGNKIKREKSRAKLL